MGPPWPFSPSLIESDRGNDARYVASEACARCDMWWAEGVMKICQCKRRIHRYTPRLKFWRVNGQCRNRLNRRHFKAFEARMPTNRGICVVPISSEGFDGITYWAHEADMRIGFKAFITKVPTWEQITLCFVEEVDKRIGFMLPGHIKDSTRRRILNASDENLGSSLLTSRSCQWIRWWDQI